VGANCHQQRRLWFTRNLGWSPAGFLSILARMSTTGRIPSVLAATAALAEAAAPAHAATYNHKFSQLNFPPKNSYSQDRIVTLKGTYEWGRFGANQSKPVPTLKTRRVRLVGRYQMLDRVVPWGKVYRHYAELINLRTGGKVRMIQALNDGNGVYYWGSKIWNVRG
jgi:hypothetical protein